MEGFFTGFFGHSFVFHETPCEAFDLMIYNIGSDEQGGSVFASTVDIREETVGLRSKPYFYGVEHKNKLEFEMVFGVNQDRIDRGNYLDRYEMDAVATWLTGHNEYHWLAVEQDDMQYIRYKCMITELSMIEYDRVPWALRAKVICDGPYAYLYPHEYVYEVDGEAEYTFFNESSVNDYYRPQVTISITSGDSFEIINETDAGRSMRFSGVPQSINEIHVDNDHCVITCDRDLNVYPYCNMRFLRMVRGYNHIRLVGHGTLHIFCEFPINPGG